MSPRIVHHGRFISFACHLLMIALSMVSAFLLRFDLSIPAGEVQHLVIGFGMVLVTKGIVFFMAGLHRGWWRFASFDDLYRIGLANLVGSSVFTLSTLMLVGSAFPRSVYAIDFMICFLLTTGIRYSVRLYNEALAAELGVGGRKRILIYGAGSAGMALAREIKGNSSLKCDVIGFLDDDPRKWKSVIMGISVLGSGREAARISERCRRLRAPLDEVIIAIPSADGRHVREALANCRAAGLECKIVPALGELLSGKVLSAQIRKISLEDLLGRDPVKLDEEQIRVRLAEQNILVTGAAGSIGSELCRQIARFRPARLIAFDKAESDLFRIDLELRAKFPKLEIVPAIGDICDDARLSEVIRGYSVSSIFHAAAYKHVPLMEMHLLEAVHNNIMGTFTLVKVAVRHKVSNFLMISSDKAVNPSSIMGLTKRVTELTLSSMPDGPSNTKLVSVRFGNVLGSNGSVVPLFESQIAAGGPVTVTHPDARRYFMTISEAVQLVLQASTMGNGGEVFVLDMGEPVKIVDLARNLIRLSGLAPDEDIEIRYTGLRRGEKLFEELRMEGENVLATYHEKIKIFRSSRLNPLHIERWMVELQALMTQRDETRVLKHLRKLVPEYVGAAVQEPCRSVGAVANA
jgi:FlaA1/EpsC-like NDP-sugar epimerase